MVGIMMANKQSATSHWWWLERHNSTKRSLRLESTLSELDQKTEAMLKLIDEDADSFSKHAEMYYKKRPELISMVQEFYKAHRSLVERYDQIKYETPTRVLTTLGSPLLLSDEKSCQEKLPLPPITDQSYDSYSDSFEHEESIESEVEDPEEGNKSDQVEMPLTPVEIGNLNPHKTTIVEMAVLTNQVELEVRKLSEEIERLRKQSAAQREELDRKDEEKREVIRQLSMAVALLKEENECLRKSANKVNNNNGNNVLGGFFRKLFNGSFLGSSEAIVVAL